MVLFFKVTYAMFWMRYFFLNKKMYRTALTVDVNEDDKVNMYLSGFGELG